MSLAMPRSPERHLESDSAMGASAVESFDVAREHEVTSAEAEYARLSGLIQELARPKRKKKGAR